MLQNENLRLCLPLNAYKSQKKLGGVVTEDVVRRT